MIGVFVLRADAPELFDGLIGRGLPLMVVSALGGIATLRFVFRGQYVPARIAAAIAVTAVLWGWAAGQYPYILASQLTIDDAAAGPSTLTAMLVSMAIGSLILVPSLIYLFAVFQRPARRAAAPERSTGLP